MNKEDFILDFNDVCEQNIDFDELPARSNCEAKALQIAGIMQTGLIAYERKGKRLKLFTSKDLYEILQVIKPGTKVYDFDGKKHTIISNVFYISGECCIRTECEGYKASFNLSNFDWTIFLENIR